MREKIIGRKRELERLDAIHSSDRAELVAIYGRRRIGKTFLVKEYFNEEFDYYATGVFEGTTTTEIDAFCDGLYRYAGVARGSIKSWMEAFAALRDYLETISKNHIIVFLDELPWFDIPPGQFLKAFEWFWNSWGSTKRNLKLIVCGSSTTWMTDKFICGKGGLYNRTTERIYLAPFNLYESEQLLRHNGIDWNRQTILDAYMVFGGVPLYLGMLQRHLSLDANIDELYFSDNAPLAKEYEFLFRSLFRNYGYYMNIVDAISSKNMGISRKEIQKIAKIPKGGVLTTALSNLEACDFIRRYSAYGKKERDALYQLTDLSVLFFKRFVEKYNGRDEKHWTNLIDHQSRRTWTGIAFEQVCLLHAGQIKQALGISGVMTELCSWHYAGDEYTAGAQIDMLISRRDNVINICEMKYSRTDYEVTSKVYREIQTRRSTFASVSKTRNSLHITLVTPWALKRNAHSDIVNQTITMDHLFAPKV